MNMSDTLQEKIKGIFSILHVSDLPLIGEGGEAYVYNYGEDKVLKIFKSSPNKKEVEKMNQLFKLVDSMHLTFETPLILEIGEFKDSLFLIEKKLKGNTIDKVYSQLNAEQRKALLQNYLEAIESLSHIFFDQLSYGTILSNVDCTNWKEFIEEKSQSKKDIILPFLQEEGISYDEIISNFRNDIDTLQQYPAKNLVHGDYFFGNVLVDENLTISAVIDFGWWSCIGDHLMDIAGVIMFLDLYQEVSQIEKDYLNDLISKKYGTAFSHVLSIYRVYYSLLLADCKEPDPKAYNWSIHNLNEYLKS